VTSDSISVRFDKPFADKTDFTFGRSAFFRVFIEVVLLYPPEKPLAHRYTDFPENTGERNLAKQLAAFKDSKLHLWFGIDFVPGVRDNDILICHENAGIFVVEVKAVNIESIDYFGWEKYRIKGRKEDDPPHRQANRAMHSLRNFLAPRTPDAPYLMSTACWPLISRNIWNRWWNDERVVGEYANRMIFREDIEGGVSALVDRLKYIWQYPPAKEGAKYPYRHNPAQLERLRAALSVKAEQRAAPSDLEKLRIIENKVTRESLNEASPGGGKRIFYYGYPGTGKTFRLLQLGVAHALAGYKVLFSCFNKVLAADIRRILSHSEKLPLSEGSLLVQDVFAIASDYADRQPPQKQSDYDRWGETVLADMKTVADILPKYETVLIDEAQDMKDWALEMLELLSASNATICVAGGAGQNLYGESSRWLVAFAKAARQIRLNRNFRNTAPVGRLAHVFYEAALDKKKIPNVLKRFVPKTTADHEQMLLFERPEGHPPSLINIDESNLENAIDNEGGISAVYFRAVVDEYRRIIEGQLGQLSTEERHLDLLILVPKQKCLERTCALEAIKELGVSYIDYTEDDYRRYIAQPDMVRLCTFHSARGIEGRRVIILGIEHLESLSQELGISLNNLGYITLSRAIFECMICVRPTVDSRVYEFIETTVNELRNLP
jgi:hypothetical protein